MNDSLPTAKDRTLFTPGPLTTSLDVKQAMLRDAGSWHFEFNQLVTSLRNRVLQVAGLSREKGYECIFMQGSGTFGVEAVLASVIPQTGKLLLCSNGAYGERMIQMAVHQRIPHVIVRSDEHEVPSVKAVEEALKLHPDISHVACVHCETTTGILNPISEIAAVVRQFGKSFIVDAMSSFGALPIDFERDGIDYLITSANKCFEGVPGFSIVIARREPLLASEGSARCLSLDLVAQLKGFEKNGQFRYTPPTHSILAFQQALKELDLEGGPSARLKRYEKNHETLVSGMKSMGFRPYLSPSVQSCVITSFHFPAHPNFTFDAFYRRLCDLGMIIYPGKISKVDCFRIGSIGRIFESDVHALLNAVRLTLKDLNIPSGA